MPKQIPVYLFVGQLESGKTKFIQETMEDPNFDSGDKTLLLVCEEGEIEYDPKKFAFGGVHVAQIEDKSELTQENLTALEKKSGCGRVIIEYNGMWLVQELYDAMPDNWLVYQCLATADGTTIKTYALHLRCIISLQPLRHGQPAPGPMPWSGSTQPHCSRPLHGRHWATAGSLLPNAPPHRQGR